MKNLFNNIDKLENTCNYLSILICITIIPAMFFADNRMLLIIFVLFQLIMSMNVVFSRYRINKLLESQLKGETKSS